MEDQKPIEFSPANPRDMFAMAAMGMYFTRGIMDEKTIEPSQLAKDSYTLADAMIAARDAAK